MSERLEIDLSSDRYEQVQIAVEGGHYDSASAVVDEALSLWEKEREKRLIDEIKQLVAEAEASGYEPWEGADVLNRQFREKYAYLIKT